jgi:hypothetical protein
MRNTPKASDVAELLTSAVVALKALEKMREEIPGLLHFQRRIGLQRARLERMQTLFEKRRCLDGRGTACGGEKRAFARINGQELGGRPPRESMARVLAEERGDPASAARLRLLPARLLIYARQRSNSTVEAVEWLLQPQPEFNGACPLHCDRRLQRKFSARLQLVKRVRVVRGPS